MTRKIKISTPSFETKATLLEDERPKTCEEIWSSLPLEGKAAIYKKEVYFDIPVEINPEDAKSSAKQGDVSYWPDGPSFCIFFGDSQSETPINTFAKLEEGVEKFREVEEGEKIRVQKSE